MHEFLMDNGMARKDHHFLIRGQKLRRHCGMDNDRYVTNERLIDADGKRRWAGEVFGYGTARREHYQRYRLPVVHTEPNRGEGPRGTEAERSLRKQWSGLTRMRQIGRPMLRFTWYSLTDQGDRNSCLRKVEGKVNPHGLYDHDQRIRPVGRAHQRLIAGSGKVLRQEDACLRLPPVAA